MAILGAVVFGQHGDECASVFGPGAHLDGSGVQFADRRSEHRRPHVETECEHDQSAIARRAAATCREALTGLGSLRALVIRICMALSGSSRLP